ncbi:MAG: homocysteine S-methyltransferase family protein [Candidatus Hodarchaeales archaeon]
MDFLSAIQEEGILLFDGSMGTQLMMRGLGVGELPDSWNLKKPEIIKELFKEYYSSGSDMVQTATFRANELALKEAGIENLSDLQIINETSARLLRSVCPPGKFIVGDIGPSGKFLPPVGNTTYEELEQSFLKQVQVLAPFIDVWHVETMSDIQEIKAAITAIKKVSKIPIIASMTFKKTPKGFFTVMGNPVDQCISELIDTGVAVVGSNCGFGSDEFIDLVKAIRNVTPDYPISIKPNAGQPEMQNGILVYKQPPEKFVLDIKSILEFDVQIIGGCCGTGPTHIKLLRKLITELNGSRHE